MDEIDFSNIFSVALYLCGRLHIEDSKWRLKNR